MGVAVKEQIDLGTDEEETEQFLAGLGTAAASDSTVLPTADTPPAASETVPVIPAVPATDDTEVTRLKKERDDAIHRLNTVQGMFNKSETKRLQEELDAIKAQIAAKPAPVPEPPKSAMSDEDYAVLKEEVGEKAANIQRKIADSKNAADPEVLALKAELQEVKGKAAQVEQAQAQTADERFFATLDTAAPDWKKVNGWEAEGIAQDPRLSGFMAQTIPGTAFTYQDALNSHYQNRNAAKVAEIFNLFSKSVGLADTPPPPTDDKTKKGEAEMITEPTRTGGGTPPPADNSLKKTYTQAEVDKFDKLYHLGRLKGEPAKIEAMWDELQLAIFEGRVR